MRCPHDKEGDNFKYDLIEEGYKENLYSVTIRDELKARRLYTIILWNNRQPKVGYLCQFGCFALSTKMLVADHDMGFTHLPARKVMPNARLAGLETELFFDDPIMVPKSIEKIIKGKEGENEKLIAFELSTSETLRVTVNHGMVLNDGRVVASQNVKQSDVFVGYDGRPVSITKISNYDQNEDVINFRLAGSNTGSNHILGAQGVLVGDHAWQSDMRDDLNAIFLRRSVSQTNKLFMTRMKVFVSASFQTISWEHKVCLSVIMHGNQIA